MFPAPAQPPAMSYPYRVKRKPVPSYDFDPSYSETDLKHPVICSSTVSSRSVDDITADLPRISYISRKPDPLYALPPGASPPATARDTSHVVPSWPKGHLTRDSEFHSVDISSMQHASTTQRRHSPEHHAEPHYHKRTQSTPTVLLQAALPSNPGTSPPPYIYSQLQFDVTNSSVSFPPPLFEMSPEGVSSVNMQTTIDPVLNPSSPQSHSSDGSYSLPSVSSHTRSPSEEVSLFTTKAKEQMFAWLLRPIRMNLGVGRKGDPQSECRRRNMSPRPSSGPIGSQGRPSVPTPAQSLRPVKRNVLRAARRRSHSLSSGTMLRSAPPTASPVQFSVDIELDNFSRQRVLAPPLAPQPAIHSPLKQTIVPARPQTSPGLANPWLRPRSWSHSQQHLSKRPATASAATEEDRMPTIGQLAEAASLFVIAESGVRVSFGDLFLERKTVVIFIRHFWCPYCQDYMFSISNTVSPAALKRVGVDLVVISNGSHNMIQSYRKIFHTPFTVYTDPIHQVYRTLGMTLRTMNPGPESQRGAYIRHGVAGGFAMVVVNAFKFKVPVWENGGDIEQLGGEFVLGPGLECTYAHRMHTTRSHAPIQRVLAAAGVDLYARWELPASNSRQLFSIMSEREEAKWMEDRNQCLAKLRDRKYSRRTGECAVGATCDVLRENLWEPTAGAVSSAGLIMNDEVGMPDMLAIGGQSTATLAVVEQKVEADFDESREEEDQRTEGSDDTLPGLTYDSSATSGTSDAESFKSSSSYCNWECCLDKRSHTDET